MQLRYPVFMLKRHYEGQESCSVARALEIIGERWTWLIIRDAFLGLTKFDEFQESLGIARNVLIDRLNRLVAEGIFERVLYNERPARYEYRLTEKGSDLFTALNAIRQWGDQYLSAKPMRLLRRRSDKRPVVASLVPEGAPVLASHEIELVPGPGFPRHAHRLCPPGPEA
jgi:DNA-binding HxlR family transcriptional regulator